jgi:hypothetical protein
LEYLDLRCRRVNAWGTAEHLTEFEKKLQEEDWLFDPERK